MTLAQHFRALRAERKLSLRDVGKRAKLNQVTIWKIENSCTVRANTLGRALRALGLREEHGDFILAFTLWVREQYPAPIVKNPRGNGRAVL
jgi:hypothetical protein